MEDIFRSLGVQPWQKMGGVTVSSISGGCQCQAIAYGIKYSKIMIRQNLGYFSSSNCCLMVLEWKNDDGSLYNAQ